MWLVLAAMRRPISVLVAILGIALCAIMAFRKMPIDIFPNLGIPVIYVAQPYGGLTPSQMEGFISSYYEYHFLYITGIKQVESKSIQGVSLIKLEFHPGTNMSQAVAETVAQVNRSRAFMPPGTVPPFVVRFDAGSVPVGQLVFSSESRSLGEIQDLALFKVRPMFASLPGVSAPPPFGGNQRTVVVHIDPERLRNYNMAPDEIVRAVSQGNVIQPAGNVRIGDRTLLAPSNSVVSDIHELENIPIKLGAGPTVFLRDVGWVENSSDILTGYALVNGRRAVYIPVTKRADASTWSVVENVKKALPDMRAAIPPDIKVSYEFDQSGIVKHSLEGLGFEGFLGAILTALMVLLFLKDWRSAFIVIITIPVSVLSALAALWITGQTLNIMSLGGLALAIGILVDEATVTIENIHSHLAQGTSKARAVMDSAREIALPKLLVLICVLAVFIPSFFMSGVPKALFVPLSLAVGFAMTASYFLSQTFVPVLATWLLKQHPITPSNPSGRFSFSSFQERYAQGLDKLFMWRKPVVVGYFLITSLLLLLIGSQLGTELFPSVNTGEFKLRLRAATGTRVERTEQITLKALDIIEKTVGAGNVKTTLAFVGAQPPSYPINTIYLFTSGPHEAVLSVALKKNAVGSMPRLKEQLRQTFSKELPDVSLSFEPGDLIGQVTSLGAPTPIEISVTGKSLDADRTYANKLMAELKKVPILRDLQFGQPLDYPTLKVDIDRERAGQLGVTVDQVGKSLVAATSSSRFTQPNYWLDSSTGTAYQIQVEVPQSKMASLEDLMRVPVSSDENMPPSFLGDLASLNYGTAFGEVDRLNNQRMVTITSNIHGNDLGSAARAISKAMERVGEPPHGVKVAVRGQVKLMQDTLNDLQVGLLIAIIAVLLLLAANFQSFRLAFIVLTSIPAVLAGVVIMLLITGTTINIQSYMGAIMAIGVSVANAILLITFAEDLRKEAPSSVIAAKEGALRRLRPILMTSIAMIAGMIPMALAFSEGGEQTAPLGRAVIGGLIASTIATLTVLPLIFGMAQEKASNQSASLDPDDPESRHFDRPTDKLLVTPEDMIGVVND